MKNIIYAYKKIKEDVIVYVGQTTNLHYRQLQHEKYDPYNPNNREYHLPLSRGIRKYGLDAYQCVVLEEVENQELLDNREKYWISFYNTYEDPSKYNLTPGGSPKDYKFTYFSDKLIDYAVDLIKNSNYSFQEIAEETGISIVMLSEINHGKRRKRDFEQYPLRELTKGKKITSSQLQEIKDLLENSTLPMTEIAIQYRVSAETIRNINKGKRQHNESWSYPLRKENKWTYKN